MKLVVGLGNPGKEYVNTRHNIGFSVLDNYLKDEKWSKNKLAFFIKKRLSSNDVIFLKPTTFMNESGEAVKYFTEFYKILPRDILIIHDDMDLNLGKYKIKVNSSSGGHNGIKSIIKMLGTQEFIQLKIGIAKPINQNVIDYVLQKFSINELNSLTSNFNIFNNIIDDFLNNNNAENLMNKYNSGKNDI
jgi:peptidyl-tRNA hydrolase, PTH1 family